MTLRDQLTIEPIETVDPTGYSEAVRAYFAHYGLDGDWCEAEHLFGTFKSGSYTLAGHLYQPSHYTATVVLLHGYLNHTGQFRHLIRFLLENGFAVAVYDFPGHGLSGGERAVIKSFDEYVQTARDFLAVVKQYLTGPFYAIGFSTGAGILIEMIRQQADGDYDKIILAAPLIHWAGYEQSKGTYKVYIKFTKKIPRFYRKNSSDKEHLIFNKTQDYLHCKHLSLEWVKALFDWNEKVSAMSVCERQILVIQGDKDGTVEWEYNLKLIDEKFSNAEVKMIAGANHELFNETIMFKQKALEYVSGYFK